MKVSLSNLPEYLLRDYDVFIASASYEDRCLSVPNAILSSITIAKKLVSVSKPHEILFMSKVDYFESKGFNKIYVDNMDQFLTMSNLLYEIKTVLSEEPAASFLIDISTFTRQTLLILFRLLRNYISINNVVDFVYTCAKEYAVGLPESEKWLSKGIVEVNSVLGYLGVIRPSRPYHLIVLMGYELERAISLINEYEPSKITVGFGRENSSISTRHHKLNKQKIDLLVSEYPYINTFEFSCIDIETSKNDILCQVSSEYKFNTIISPMNNKISTLACGLVAFENETIQLAIAIPALYNFENYSTPSNECYCFKISSLMK